MKQRTLLLCKCLCTTALAGIMATTPITKFLGIGGGTACITDISKVYAAVTIAPQDFKVTADSSGKYTFTWTKPASDSGAVAYVLECSKDGSTWNELEYGGADGLGKDIYVSKYKDILNSTVGQINYFRMYFVDENNDKGPYSEVLSSKYENFVEQRDLEIAEAKRLQALETTETAEGGYSLDTVTTAGMKKVWTHELYTASAEMIGYSFSGTGQFPNAKVQVKYTFTPKCNGKWTMDWNEDPNYPLSTSDFKDEAGNVLDGSDTKVAGKTYTATVIQSVQNAYGYQEVSLKAWLNYPEIEGAADFSDIYQCDFEYILPLVISTISEDIFVKERTATSITLDAGQLATIGYRVDSVGIFYKEKSATSWKQAESTTITGLKGNTEYQIKVNYIKTVWANGDHTKTIALTSPDSNAITVLTDMSAKVDIKSVKISKAKVKKYKYKGYWWWSGATNRWIWKKPSTSICTRFKVTVTIKKKVPGAKGYWINIDGANQYTMPGNKTKCTFYALVQGKRIGKKVTVKACAYNRAEGQGRGPLGKGKSVKIKK